MNTRFSLSLCSLLLALLLFTACGGKTEAVVLELELNENYSDADPFINAKLFTVTEDVESLQMELRYQMEVENGLLEIADRETGEPLWSVALTGLVDEHTETISIGGLKKGREYLLQFTGSKVKDAHIRLLLDNPAVQEMARPGAAA